MRSRSWRRRTARTSRRRRRRRRRRTIFAWWFAPGRAPGASARIRTPPRWTPRTMRTTEAPRIVPRDAGGTSHGSPRASAPRRRMATSTRRRSTGRQSPPVASAALRRSGRSSNRAGPNRRVASEGTTRARRTRERGAEEDGVPPLRVQIRLHAGRPRALQDAHQEGDEHRAHHGGEAARRVHRDEQDSQGEGCGGGGAQEQE